MIGASPVSTKPSSLPRATAGFWLVLAVGGVKFPVFDVSVVPVKLVTTWTGGTTGGVGGVIGAGLLGMMGPLPPPPPPPPDPPAGGVGVGSAGGVTGVVVAAVVEATITLHISDQSLQVLDALQALTCQKYVASGRVDVANCSAVVDAEFPAIGRTNPPGVVPAVVVAVDVESSNWYVTVVVAVTLFHVNTTVLDVVVVAFSGETSVGASGAMEGSTGSAGVVVASWLANSLPHCTSFATVISYPLPCVPQSYPVLSGFTWLHVEIVVDAGNVSQMSYTPSTKLPNKYPPVASVVVDAIWPISSGVVEDAMIVTVQPSSPASVSSNAWKPSELMSLKTCPETAPFAVTSMIVTSCPLNDMFANSDNGVKKVSIREAMSAPDTCFLKFVNLVINS